MRRPQFLRDASGLYLVCGRWTVSRHRGPWRPRHLRQYAGMGHVRVDLFVGFGFKAMLVRTSLARGGVPFGAP
jgi:hypothetical protein